MPPSYETHLCIIVAFDCEQLEKERQMSEKEEVLRRKREDEARARRILEEDLANDGRPRVPRKSKFVSIYVTFTFSFLI